MIKEGGKIVIKQCMIFDFYNPRERAIKGDKFHPTLVLENGREVECTTKCGKRPYVVISANEFNDSNWNCLIAPLGHLDNSNIERLSRFQISLEYSGRPESYVDLSSVTSIGQNEIDPDKFIGFISESDMRRIEKMMIMNLVGDTSPETLSKYIYINDVQQTKQENLIMKKQQDMYMQQQKPSTVKEPKFTRS